MRNRFTAFALILIAIISAACESSANEEQTAEVTGEAAVISETEAGFEISGTSGTDVKPETVTEKLTIEAVPTEPVTAASETKPDSEDKCEYEWQHAYAEYIDQMFFYWGLYIDDINGDDIPEAVIEVNPFGYTTILYYTENGLAELELATMSDWGSVNYIADTKQIYFSPMRGHTNGTYGYTEEYLYDWTGTEYTETLSVLRESGYWYESDGEFYEELGQAYINGEKVDNDTFEAKLAEIGEIVKGNGYFPVVDLQDENFASYAKEKLPDFKRPEFDYGQYN